MTTSIATKQIVSKKKSHAFGKAVYLLGNDSDGINYWLEAPSWDCGWYWGFGYVETYKSNRQPSTARDIDSHSHISNFLGQQEEYNFSNHQFEKTDFITNLIDNKKFKATTFNTEESIELTDLFNRFYSIKKGATENDNKVIIPEITSRIIEILSPK